MAFAARRVRPVARPRSGRALLVACALLSGALGALGAPWGPRVACAAPDDGRAEYARLVAAAKAKRWGEALALASALVAGPPDAPWAPAATFLASEAAWWERRYELSLSFAELYPRRFPRGPHGERLGLRRGECLFRLGRGAEARAAFEGFLRSAPGPVAARRARDLLARIEPADVTVRGSVVLDYGGKYAGDPRLARRLAEVERAVPEATRRVRERLGLGADALPAFRVRFRDTGEVPEGTYMSSVVELVGDAPRPAVVVRTERLLVGYDVATVLTHELTHVAQRHRLGYASDAVPAWAREGVATWVAEQGRRRLTTDLWALAGAPDPVPTLLNGLTDRTQADDYAENWLAFAWIEATRGPEAARALARRVCERGDAEAAFADAAGLPFAEAVARERAWAEAVVRADLAAREAYLAPRRVLAAGRAADAVAAYDAFLSAAPEHPFAPKARLDRAVALAKAGRLRDASASFSEVLDSPWADVLAVDVVEQRARIAAAHGDLAGVEAWGGRFLRDFSWTKPERLAAVRALWAKAGGTPPPPPPEDAAPPSDDPDGTDARDDAEAPPDGR